MNTYLLKKELRKKARLKRDSICDEKKKEKSAKITHRIVNMQSFQTAETVFCYVPLKNEVDTFEIIKTALKSNKRVAVPRCREGKPLMDFYYIKSLGDLSSGSYGILEPLPLRRNLCKEKEGFCILPGMCFDRFGTRLGYGKGYYDRFLHTFNGVTVGVCFSDMLSVRPLPINFHDVAANFVVTDKEMIKTEI